MFLSALEKVAYLKLTRFYVAVAAHLLFNLISDLDKVNLNFFKFLLYVLECWTRADCSDVQYCDANGFCKGIQYWHKFIINASIISNSCKC